MLLKLKTEREPIIQISHKYTVFAPPYAVVLAFPPSDINKNTIINCLKLIATSQQSAPDFLIKN